MQLKLLGQHLDLDQGLKLKQAGVRGLHYKVKLIQGPHQKEQFSKDFKNSEQNLRKPRKHSIVIELKLKKELI